MKGGHMSNYTRAAVVSEGCPRQMGQHSHLTQVPVVLLIFIFVLLLY